MQRGLRRSDYVLLALSVVPLLLTIFWREQGDLPHYQDIARAIWRGEVPYRDVWIEYPPYAVFWFLPAGWISNSRVFSAVFGCFLLCFDIAIKAVLLKEGTRQLPSKLALLPLALYTIVGWSQAFWYLKRYDLIPAALTLAAVAMLSRNQYGRGGALLGLAIGTKGYAAVMIPALLFSRRREGARRIARGLVVSLLPLALISLWWPWWRFAAFQAGRGLQVESLSASLFWLIHHLFGMEVEWFPGDAAYELRGGLVAKLKPWIEVLWAIAVIFCAALSARSARRRPPATAAEIARLVLLPLVALVAFSPVLSPQFTIWFAGLAALTWSPGRAVPLVLIAAAALTGLVYPAPGYQTGLNLFFTLVLLTRNALLVGTCFALVREFGGSLGSSSPAASA